MKTKILERILSVGIGVGLSLAGLTSGCTSYSREYCEAHGIDYEQQERMRTNPFPALEGLGILLSAGGKTRGQRNAGAAGAEIMGRNLDRQNAVDAAREGKTVVNVGGGQQVQIFTVKVINLDTGLLEMENSATSSGENLTKIIDTSWDYMYKISDKDLYPKKGYNYVILKNGEVIRSDTISKGSDKKLWSSISKKYLIRK